MQYNANTMQIFAVLYCLGDNGKGKSLGVQNRFFFLNIFFGWLVGWICGCGQCRQKGFATLALAEPWPNHQKHIGEGEKRGPRKGIMEVSSGKPCTNPSVVLSLHVYVYACMYG